MKGPVLVADDLTGALDAAARFTGACGPLPVYLGASSPGSPASAARAHVVFGPDEALAMTRTALQLWRCGGTAFKKIDSLLRGHWAVEIAVALQGGDFDRVVLAPAFPALGRRVCNGFVYVTVKGRGADRVKINMAAALAAAGVDSVRVIAPEAMAVQRAPVLICDAADETAMLAIAAAGSRLPGRTLWCGSAGLAGALAGCSPVAAPQLSGPLLMIIGSNHPVMLSQLAALRAAASMPEIHVSADAPAAAALIAAALEREGRALALFNLPAGLDRKDAAAHIDAAVAQLMSALAPPATLIASGGNTLLSIMRAAGAASLTVEGEAQPGIPVSKIEGGAWKGVSVISKSGAFGERDTLLQLLEGIGS